MSSFAAGLGALVLVAGVTAAAAGAAPTTGFLSAPTEQLAVPGMAAGAEVTPEGDLYTGWAEYELRFGRDLVRWDQPTRTLPDPGVPLLSSALADGPVRYTVTLFAVPAAGRPVAYETVTATNGSGRPREARVAMLLAYTRGRQIRGPHGVLTGAFRYERPVSASTPGAYEQPGQPFSSSFGYTVAGRDLDRSGLLLARGPAAPSRPLATPARTPRATLSRSPRATPARSPGATPALSMPTAPHDGRVFSARLVAHGSVSFTWQIPLDPPPARAGADRALDAMPLGAARAALRSLWATQEAGMMRIEVPEAKVDATYRAAIAEMLESRILTPTGWEQSPNRLQYRAFWIRDAAIETQALDLAGLHVAAAQNLDFIDTFQQADGLFISQAGQYDEWGEALWALAQHAELAQEPAYAAAQLGRIGAAIGWLSAASAADPLGLLPASNPDDNELAYGHITGDDLWAAAGLRSAIAAATLAGQAVDTTAAPVGQSAATAAGAEAHAAAATPAEASADAAAWTAVDQRFEAALDRAIAAAVAREGHIPPVLDAKGGQDWGNYWATFPVQVLGTRSPAVTATLRWARAHMAEGLPTYLDGSELHDYLGFRIFQAELAVGDEADAVAGLYAELAHTTATDGGWETGIGPYRGRASATNLAPHGTFAAEYVALLRNMLVTDTSAGGVELLAGASSAWLGPGQRITVAAAPTDHGVISFAERSTRRGETLTWHDTLAAGTPLSWTLPGWARDVRTANGPVSGGAIALNGDSGSLTVMFNGRRPAQSYARTAGALNAAYRAHGRPAPLVAAP
jgi:hypothetical protein